MRVAVSRILVRANYLAQDAAVGTFPSVQPLTEPIVWRSAQQQRMAEAVAAGHWQPLFDDAHTLNVQQRDDELFC